MKTLNLTIESSNSQLENLSSQFTNFLRSVIKDEKLIHDLQLCLIEAVTNIIKHAFGGKPGNVISIRINFGKKNVICRINHEGYKFPPPQAGKELRYNPEDIMSLPESGMGVFLMKQIMDHVAWNSKSNHVELIMRKQIK